MNREALLNQLMADEGVRLKPYRCTEGRLTIGVGRNLDDVGITHEEAMILLMNDVKRAERDLTIALPWVVNLSEARQNVLLNMVFNLGISRFLKFQNTIGMIQRSEYHQAATEMLRSKWADQVGDRAKRLADIMRTGIQP